MTYAFMFLAMIGLDFVWARYTKTVADGKPLAAACYSIGIMLGGAVTVIGYMEDHWMLIPLVLGSFIGTYFTVKHGE
jgi:hypothetical protein